MSLAGKATFAPCASVVCTRSAVRLSAKKAMDRLSSARLVPAIQSSELNGVMKQRRACAALELWMDDCLSKIVNPVSRIVTRVV